MSTFNIQNLLQQQQAEVEKLLEGSKTAEQLAISEYNNSRIIALQELITSVMTSSNKEGNKSVWNMFAFGTVSGAILGILHQCFLSFKDKNKICEVLGISPAFVDIYLQCAGNAPYAKNGIVIEARPMDIEKTRNLVKIVGTKLQIIVTDDDLAMINEENEASRNARAMEYIANSEKEEAETSKYIKEETIINANINVGNKTTNESIVNGEEPL